MKLRSAMVNFFTLCPITSITSSTDKLLSQQCLTIMKGKLVPMMQYHRPYQLRTFADDTGKKKGPEKEEPIEQVKMPGFVHPETHNEEGYFTQKAHQELEELKKKLAKPTIDNKEKKE